MDSIDVILFSGKRGVATSVIIWFPAFGEIPLSGAEVGQAVLDHHGCEVDQAPPGAQVLAKVDGVWQAARVPLLPPTAKHSRRSSRPVKPASAEPVPPVQQPARPAHRPRRDPAATRVNLVVRVHPTTRELVAAEAARTGESQGQVIDRLAALIPSDHTKQ